MGGKKNKKKGVSTSKASTSKAYDDDDDNFDFEVEDIKTDIEIDHIVPILNFLLRKDWALGKLFLDFQKAFGKNYSQLTMGCFLAKTYDILLLLDACPEERERYEQDVYGKDEDLSCPRLILIYLIYRIRDFDPWLKRKADKTNPNNADNMKGHVFLEFFLNVASNIEMYDGNQLTFGKPKITPCEMRFAQAILYQQGPKFSSIPAGLIQKSYTVATEVPNPIAYDDMRLTVNEHIMKFINIDRQKASKTWPGVLLYILHKGHDYRNKSEEVEDVLTCRLAELFRISLVRFVQVAAPQRTCCANCIPSPNTPGYYDYANLALPEISKERPTIPPCAHDFDFWKHKPGALEYPPSLVTAVLPSPKPKKTVIKEIHSEVVVDGQPTPQIELVSVEVNDSPGSSKHVVKEISSVYSVIMPKLLSGEQLSLAEIATLQDHLQKCEDDDAFFTEINNFDPKLICNYVESNVKFASYLVYRIVTRDPVKHYIYMDAMKEMGFSVQCVEIVLRLYRSIAGIPKLALLEYFNSLMQFCDQATSSSQKGRYVRIFSTFVTTILNDGIIRGDKTDEYSRNSLQQILSFIVRYSEYKEATELYKRIKDVLKKWDS